MVVMVVMWGWWSEVMVVMWLRSHTCRDIHLYSVAVITMWQTKGLAAAWAARRMHFSVEIKSLTVYFYNLVMYLCKYSTSETCNGFPQVMPTAKLGTKPIQRPIGSPR